MAETSSRGEAAFDLALEILDAGFKLRAAGRTLGAVTAWGGGNWGLMRSLRIVGPQTVPQIARARPVARQHIQRLVNELADQGLVEFVDNPAHRRSKLVRLTANGERAADALSTRIREWMDGVASGMDEAELRGALAVVEALRRRIEAALGLAGPAAGA